VPTRPRWSLTRQIRHPSLTHLDIPREDVHPSSPDPIHSSQNAHARVAHQQNEAARRALRQCTPSPPRRSSLKPAQCRPRRHVRLLVDYDQPPRTADRRPRVPRRPSRRSATAAPPPPAAPPVSNCGIQPEPTHVSGRRPARVRATTQFPRLPAAASSRRARSPGLRHPTPAPARSAPSARRITLTAPLRHRPIAALTAQRHRGPPRHRSPPRHRDTGPTATPAHC
jgi:hypothetical protein